MSGPRTPGWRGRALLAGAALTAPAGVAFAADAAVPVHYAMNAAQSRLEFTGTQAGAPFKGVFHAFTASIDFSPDALANSKFDVTITLASVDSEDKDRDGTMRGADVFDVAHFPNARYVTHAITRTASGYAASGSLTLHGTTREVPIQFTFSSAGGGAKLLGTAQLKRLDFGVGQGDWKSTEWVKNEVSVAFNLALTPAH
jgi:polyisoprenoid-binding protein YceI